MNTFILKWLGINRLLDTSGIQESRNKTIYALTILFCAILITLIASIYLLFFDFKPMEGATPNPPWYRIDALVTCVGISLTIVTAMVGIGTHLSGAEANLKNEQLLNELNKRWPSRQIEFNDVQAYLSELERNSLMTKPDSGKTLTLMLSTIAYGIHVSADTLAEFVSFLEDWGKSCIPGSGNNDQSTLRIGIWDIEESKNYFGQKNHPWGKDPARMKKTKEQLIRLSKVLHSMSQQKYITVEIVKVAKSDLRLFVSEGKQKAYGLTVAYPDLLTKINSNTPSVIGFSTEGINSVQM